MGNQMISMLKSSALVSVIAVQELLVANQTASASFRYFEALCAAGLYYLLLTSLFMIFQSWLESVLIPNSGAAHIVKRLTRLFKLPKIAREEP
jgi:polar amino acid transport system permease protein